VIRRHRHAQLLVVLVLLLVSYPFLRGTLLTSIVDVLLLLTLVSAVVASSPTRRRAAFGLFLVALMQLASWYRERTGELVLTAAYTGLVLTFFATVSIIVLVDVFRARQVVSADTICGAVSVYLLIGLMFAFGYALLTALVPGSFVGLDLEEGEGYQSFVSYSFVTLTTLGYGNVVPANARAQVLASAEAVVGQIYLTVLVARLVALNLMSSRDDQKHT